MSASIHPTAIVETERLGEGCVVEPYASLAAGVTLSDGVQVGAGARLFGNVSVGQDVSIGANAVLGNADGTASEIRIGRGARLGANVTVSGGVVVGRGAVVEPGSVVDVDVPAHAVVRGSPARIVSYVDAMPETTEPEIDLATLEAPTKTGVAGVVLYPLTYARDLRGSLSALEFDGLPFAPRRMFAVYGVPDESVRGAHAHRKCGQLLICISGEARCIADDGKGSRQEFVLSTSKAAVYLPPMVWGMQYGYTRDACLVVLAELPYDADDYIRDYEEFVTLVESGSAP